MVSKKGISLNNKISVYIPLVLLIISFTIITGCSSGSGSGSSADSPDTPEYSEYDNICEPGNTHCESNDIYICTDAGDAEIFLQTCASSYYSSSCADNGDGTASCTCGDDWDCEMGQYCDAGFCNDLNLSNENPAPFSVEELSVENAWGGTSGTDNQATGSPFPLSAQVTMTPMVANLNDDNGDGIIDENDYPEIIFTTYNISNFTSNGILRAIHGGGPDKGTEFFANCGGIEWHEGDEVPTTFSYTDAALDPSSALAIGDLDYDGIPEIVGISELNEVIIFSSIGSVIAVSAVTTFGNACPQPSIANLDNQGFAEIIVGRNVFTISKDTGDNIFFLDIFSGTQTNGANGLGPSACAADVLGDERMEIIAGGTVYRFPSPPAGASSQADCGESFPPVTDDEIAFCNGELPYEWTSSLDGHCAVVDIYGENQLNPPGPENPLDSIPEIILVSDDDLYIFNAQDGTQLFTVPLNSGTRGGSPALGDFDSDGFPEIGIAGSTEYAVYDLQQPGTECPAWESTADNNITKPRITPETECTSDSDCGDITQFACNTALNECVCLHNSWFSETEDASSGGAGSSYFDFNNDGIGEILYNDECHFRIYNGLNGEILFFEESEMRTRMEYSVVADIDKDGIAEIISAANNESGFCTGVPEIDTNNGIEIRTYSDDIGPVRRIWNQYTYHITNVANDATIPLVEPKNWLLDNGGCYNSYRRNYNSACGAE